MDFIKIKEFMLQNTIYEMERPATDWEKIFTNNISDNNISDKRLVF